MTKWVDNWQRPHLEELFMRFEKAQRKVTPAFFKELLECLEKDAPIISPLGIWYEDDREAVEQSNERYVMAWATPEWLDVLEKIIIKLPYWLRESCKSPHRIYPRAYTHDEIWLFEALVKRFPDEGWLVLSILLENTANRAAFQFFYGNLSDKVRTADEFIKAYLSDE